MSLITKGESLSPSGVENLAFNRKLLAVLVGFALLTLSSYVRVPMYPVPMTMQTLIVLLIGGLYGWRMAGMTLASWLFAGGLGFPISPTASGMVLLTGPTAGYLFGFLLAAMIVGWLANHGWGGEQLFLNLCALTIGTFVIFACGYLWLANFIGFEKALLTGIIPFLPGAVVKLVLALAILRLTALKIKR